MAPRTQPLMPRFWSMVRVGDDDECWPWVGSHSRGYGRFWIGSRTDGSRRSVTASRFVYEQTFGAIPDGMHVLHHCDNPPCVNPAHLWAGTNDDNVRDMIAKGRQYNQRKTECHLGHPYTPENTAIHNGRRECRTCMRERDRQRRPRRRMAEVS